MVGNIKISGFADEIAEDLNKQIEAVSYTHLTLPTIA